MDTVAMEYAEFDPSFLQHTQGKTTLGKVRTSS